MPMEFFCEGCLAQVAAFGAQLPQPSPEANRYCAICEPFATWREFHPDILEHGPFVRMRFHLCGELLPSRTEAMYRDRRQPEASCEHCGRLYRGPAVYCSLICALADAC